MWLDNTNYRGKYTVFVASTMPFSFVRGMAKQNAIINLVLLGRSLDSSYSSISLTFPNVRICVAPRNFVFHAIYLAYWLLKSVTSRRPIVFFHECCCPILDILIKIFRPAGHYFPMVEMASLARLCSFDLFPAGKMRYFLQVTFLWRWFFVYESAPLGNSSNKNYFLTLKQYPASIKSHGVEESKKLSGACSGAVTLTGPPKIIFLCGLSRFDSAKVIATLTTIAEYAIINGFECFIKDHPNHEYRLGFDHVGLTTIEPTIPVQSLEDVFLLAIGISSNSLSWYGDRAISIVKLIDGLSAQERSDIENFIKKFPGGENFTYPESINEVFSILDRVLLVIHGDEPLTVDDMR